jgi:hypothetical protein
MFPPIRNQVFDVRAKISRALHHLFVVEPDVEIAANAVM